MTHSTCKSINIDGFHVFYREAGRKDAPVLLLLHGFPSSGHMFRDLMPTLAQEYYVLAPDIPGFGFSDQPSRAEFDYTFDNLTDVIDQFLTKLGVKKLSVYIFDYGAPIGLRLAIRNPDRIAAIISQSGNAYEEGLSDAWAPIKKCWVEPSSDNRNALRHLLTYETTQWQYVQGVPETASIAPESYALDAALLARNGNDEIQLDLLCDYASNVALYPVFQKYFRAHQPPLLAIWGKNDPFFLPEGAEAFRRDNPNVEVRLLDTGHFALETHSAEIAQRSLDFLNRTTLIKSAA
ncbi:alpha/beta hydrolase [Litoreibacter sp.]|nr:alpha/beta hydrolase [Litoreibacter sp.]